jgi:hypothetical protein
MKLVQREAEKLALHNAGFLAQKRLARGLRLNYTEAVALIAAQVRGGALVPTDQFIATALVFLKLAREEEGDLVCIFICPLHFALPMPILMARERR